MAELIIGLLFIAVAGVALVRHPWRRDRLPLSRAHDFWAGYRELAERRALVRRPWMEDLMHWSWDGQDWRLHGHLDPASRHPRSTTRSGWCPAVGGHHPER